MKIYKFDKFNEININTVKYINADISEHEYITYLNAEILNENVGDFITSIKEKVINILYTYITKAYEIGIAVFDKFKVFFKWFISIIDKFKTKHPTLYKILIITSITMIILMVSATTAHAQSNNQSINKDKLDLAIGWLDYLKSKGGYDNMQVSTAMGHLIDLKDGKVDISTFSKESINMADSAIKVAEKIIQEAKTDYKTDKSAFNLCIELIKKGSSYIDVIYNKTTSTENIKLLIK